MAIQIPTHTWLKKLSVAYVQGPSTELAVHVASDLMETFQRLGHTIRDIPSEETNVILTTARLGEPLGWRQALLFTARHRYKLKHAPTVITIVHLQPEQFHEWMAEARQFLGNGPEVPSGFAGISETANKVLYQQCKGSGAIMILLRVMQIQTKSIRVLLVVGKEQPESAFLFDLVGAHPQIKFENADTFYKDIATRIITVASTEEITKHQVMGPEIRRKEWDTLSTIPEMIRASQELGNRNFFTEMIQLSDVADVPGFSDAIAQQYSEGCFATWDVRINGLLATITGSARPVRKENITDKDLAVIVGVKPEQDGALIRNVEGHPNYPPSSEAVEMVGMDLHLPKISLGDGQQVPVIRSKLHGHRGVQSFDQSRVEYVSIPESYLHFPVSCSTDGQYHAVQEAFSNSSALRNPENPRKIVFTILPGHGMILAEKWVEGKRPFQMIWEAMDRKDIEITNFIPQGPFRFEARGERYHLVSDMETIVLGAPSADEE